MTIKSSIMKKLIGLLFLLGVLFSSCEKAPEEIAVTGITLNQASAEMFVGETVQLTASIQPSNATDKAVTWASSKQSVATISDNGLITAVSEGQSTITASAGGKSATCQVTVSSGFVAIVSISLDRESITLEEESSAILVATVKPDDATDKTVVWSSSNTSIATVDQSGNVTAVKEGSAAITASAGDKQATCSVTVKKKVIAVTSVTLNKTELSLYKGQSETLSATVNPDNATDKSVTWSSSNTEIAIVDSYGKVTAVAGGNAIISAKAGDQQATCDVTVTVPVESVTLDKTTVSLEEGDSITLSATVAPEDATDKSIIWSSSADDIAAVNQSGQVRAISKGKAIITAKVGEQSATCEIKVYPPVESVTLNQSSIKLDKGQSITLVATVKPDDVLDKTVTWNSSQPSIASVDQNGVVTAISGGESVITASSGGKTAMCEVSVNVPVESIVLNVSQKEMAEGQNFTLSATVTPANATDKTIVWTSDHPEIASVEKGKVSAMTIGQATITAQCGECIATCVIQVIDPDLLHKVTISSSSGYGIAIINGNQFRSKKYTIKNNSIVSIYVSKLEAPNSYYYSYPEDFGMGITIATPHSIGSFGKTIAAGDSFEFTLYYIGNNAPTATITLKYNGKEYTVSGGGQ